MTLQVIKAEDVRDGEPRLWVAHRQDRPRASASALHTDSRRDAGCQACEFAIVDRPAPHSARAVPPDVEASQPATVGGLTADTITSGHLGDLLTDEAMHVRHMASCALYCQDAACRARERAKCAALINERRAARGDLLATVDRCGVCAQPTANQNHEPVGAGLPMEPTCDACLAPEHRPEVPDVR